MESTDKPASVPSEEYHVRYVRKEDLDDLCRLVAEREIYERFLLPPFMSPEIVMSRYIASYGYNRVVAVCQNEVVGWAAITPKEPPRSHAAEIAVMVSSNHCSKGVGRKLLTSLISAADNSMGLTRLDLTVLENNSHAVHFYESLGFKREGLLKDSALYRGKLSNMVYMARLRGSDSEIN